MTLTITTTDYETYVNKEKSVQALLTAGKLSKIYQVKVVFGAGDNYATGGVSADITGGIQQDGFLFVLPEFSDAGLVFRYDKTNKKIVCYTAAASASSAVALTEVVNGSSLTNSKTFTFVVCEV